MIRAKGFLGKGRKQGGRAVEGGQESGPSTLRLAAAPTPSLRREATSPTTHPSFVPCLPTLESSLQVTSTALAEPTPTLTCPPSLPPSIRVILWGSAGGWEVAEEWGSSWGH